MINDPCLLQRFIRRVAATRPGAWLAVRLMYRLDRVVLRWSNGRTSAATLLTGLPVVTLTSTGAKSGLPRRTPLLGIPNGTGFIVIASNWGQPRYPAWYYNLRAHPRATLTVNGRSQPVVAREAQGAEAESYWRQALAVYAGFAAYRERVNGRHIPIILLTPVDADLPLDNHG